MEDVITSCNLLNRYPGYQRFSSMYQYSLKRKTQTETRGEPMVRTVKFFGNAGPMRCRFIFPESDFEPEHLIGSSNK